MQELNTLSLSEQKWRSFMNKGICNEDYMSALMGKTAEAIFELNAYARNNGGLPFNDYRYKGASRASRSIGVIVIKVTFNTVRNSTPLVAVVGRTVRN